MAAGDNEKLEIGHVLFIDIVGYSRLLIEDQKARLRQLTEIVLATPQVGGSSGEKVLRLPTGDGMALVFHESAEEPAQCALEIARVLRAHPELPVRMGIHSGPVSEVADVNARTNIAGAGINMAQRVMDCGDAGHILLSRRVADDLEQFARWKPLLHDLGECRVKHGVRLQVVNLYTSEAGNPARPAKFAQRTRRAAVLGIVAAAGILAALGAALLRPPSPTPPGSPPIPEKSIAVLPFDSLSDDKNNAYFAAGMQDEILTRLANLHDLKVIARTSTEKYASHPPDLPTIGAELGVAYLLEGSVQKIGNDVHVNVQLIRAGTAAHVWAQSYDRTLQHAFAVQGEIAQTVANELKVALAPAEIEKLNALPTRNAAAYDSYLKGEYALEQAWKNPGDYEKVFEPAIVNFHEAIAADPQFALAFARLAEAELAKEYFGHADGGVLHRPELLASARKNIESALQLEPEQPAAHLALGRWYTLAQHDRAAALREYRRVHQRDPRLSLASLRIATSSIAEGHLEEAVDVLSKALEFDPRNFQLLRNLSIAYTIRRDYVLAAKMDRRIVALNPADELDATNLALDIIQSSGDIPAAQQVIDSLLAHLPAQHARSAKVIEAQMALYLYRRDFAAARKYAQTTPRAGWRTDWDQAITMGEAQRYLRETVAARASFESAREALMAALTNDPEEPELHAGLSKVNAELGRPDEALREAQRAMELEPVEKDERNGSVWLLNLAVVNRRLGQNEEAIKIIERLMAMPHAGNTISAWQLKLDPEWDPLRSDPRFARIVADLPPKS